MALPREPRQKMINIMYLVLTAILALNVSAEVIEAFKTVDKSLQSSSTNINSSNEVLYKSLTKMMSEDKTKLQAAVWQPKAEQAKGYAAAIDAYINELKQELKKGAGLRMKEKNGVQVEDFKEDNLDASTRLFETNKKGDELKARLEDFKKKILDIDPKIREKFESNFPVSTDGVEGKEGKKDFTTGYFHMTPTVAALTILSKFQNNIKTVENQVVSFCHGQVGAVEVHMDQVGVLVGQSSNYLMPGQELVVTAGVGAYSSTVHSNISVNGSPITLVNGQGEYKIPSVSGAGKHTIQVSGSFTGEDGKPVPISKTIEYVVGVPGGTAVMLDKMNVFYIGVDNPVTISSGTGWDRTTVSMSGGTISGAGSNRTVRVTAVGPASLTVTADGKSSKFDFRVKRIPDPVFKVGDGKIRMTSVAFKGQDYCRAELENFDFDTKYSIVSATVYFFGANFSSVQAASITSNSLAPIKALMARCGPGSVISFDNVKVTGPDGARTIDGKSIALY
jgi:gliding motility-associated protein GldM